MTFLPFRQLSRSTAALATVLPLALNAAPVLQVDIEHPGAADLQAGFSSYTIADGNATISGYSFEVSPVNTTAGSYDSRHRTAPTGGALTEDELYRDFIFASNAGTTAAAGRASGLDTTISGLNPGQIYEVTVWSFDTSSGGTDRTSDWSVTGLGGRSQGFNDYSFIGSTPPATDADNRFTFSAVADAAGQLVVHGRQAGAAPAATTPQVFLNAISLDEQANAYSLTDVLAVDFDGDGGNPGTTQSGFDSLVLSSGTLTTGSSESFLLSGHNVTITATGDAGAFVDDRTRAAPANSGSFTDSDVLSDFIFARGGTENGIDVLVEDLKPSTTYRVDLWSFDASSPGDRVADWSANGTSLWEDYTFTGSIAPTTNDDYRFGNFITTNASGEILIEGRLNPGANNISVFLNGLQIQEADLVPEPGSSMLLLSGFGAFLLRRRRL